MEQNTTRAATQGMGQGMAAAAGAPKAAAPQKVRRVGTFTFGLLLIAAGVLLLAAMIVPITDLLNIARFAPAILIVLGIEVLIYAGRPGVILKYDFVSMVACTCIILVVGAVSVLPQAWSWFGPENAARRQTLTTQLENAVYDAVSANASLKGQVVEARCTISGDALYTPGGLSMENVNRGQVYASFTLNPAMGTAQEFAAVCQKIAAACANLPIGEFNFSTEPVGNQQQAQQNFTLHRSGLWLKDADAAAVAQSVYSWWTYDGYTFDSKESMEDWLQNKEREPNADAYEQAYEEGYIDGYNQAWAEQYGMDESTDHGDPSVAPDPRPFYPESVPDPEWAG